MTRERFLDRTGPTTTMQRGILRAIAKAGKHRKNGRTKQLHCSSFAADCTPSPFIFASHSLHFPVLQTIRPVYLPIQMRHFSANNTNDNKKGTDTEGSISSAPTAVGVQEYDDNNDDKDNEDNSTNYQQTSEDPDSVEDTEAALTNRLVYRETLNNWYRANFDVSLNDAFQATKAATSNSLWVSCFVCPITGHRLEATVLPGVEYRKGGLFTSKKIGQSSCCLPSCPILLPHRRF